MSRRPFPRWPAGLLLLALSACGTPAPRIPFVRGGWHVTAVGGERASNDRYHETYPIKGVQLTTLMPGTGGWGWDVAVRHGTTSGEDQERITNPAPPPRSIAVDNERDSKIWELTIGVRQTFRPDSRLQPYVGAGTSFFKTHNSDNYSGPGVVPQADQKHFQTVGLGLCLSTGVVWNVLRDQVREDTEFVVDLGLRGMLGDEFSFLEVTLGFGFGR